MALAALLAALRAKGVEVATGGEAAGAVVWATGAAGLAEGADSPVSAP